MTKTPSLRRGNLTSDVGGFAHALLRVEFFIPFKKSGRPIRVNTAFQIC